jgi:phage terminase Nu1 subunit (DNA packaging protein)
MPRDRIRFDQRTLAQLFGVHQRTVQRWDAEGLSAARVDGAAEYDGILAIEWRLEFERQRMAAEFPDLGDIPPRDQSESRIAAAKASLLEDELRRSRAELVPAADVLQRIREPLEAVDAQLRAAPRRHSRHWSAKLRVSRAEAMSLIHEIAEEIRASLRDAFADEDDGDG